MSKFSAKLSTLLVALSLSAFNFQPVLAQTQNTGAIQGRVFEAGSLAPIPAAIITITNEAVGLERTTVSNEQGIYYVGILPAGLYRITARKQGYENDVDPRNSVITNFLIHITNTERADQPPPIVLRKSGIAATPPITPPPAKPPVAQPSTPQQTRPGSTTQSEFALLVNGTNATRGGNFDGRFLLSLPLPGVRTFDDLAFLVPGVAPTPLPIGANVGPGIGPGVGTSGQFSVNGLRSRSNNFTIDGADNNDEEVGVRRQGFTALASQSIESVQEFQISTLLPEPQYGRNMGAQVNVVSRAGSSAFHGTLYGFFTDRALKARDAFDFVGGPQSYVLTGNGRSATLDGAPFTRPNPVEGENAYTRAQYGFVFGGPIDDQTRFFGSFERQDINGSRESHFAVPTIDDRGVFGSGGAGLSLPDGTQTLPASLTGNSFLSLFPFPNNPNGPYRANTFTEVLPAGADGSIFSVKLDNNFKAFGKAHSLTGRYNFTDDDTTLPVTGEAIFSTLRARVRTQGLALSLNSAISSGAANQFRFSYGRTRLGFDEVRNRFLRPSASLPDVPFLLNAPLFLNASANGNPAFLSASGSDSERGFGSIPGLATTGTGPIGQVKVSGYSPLGVDVFNFPQSRINNIYQFADTLITIHGRHRLIAGFDIRQSQLNSVLDRNFRPLAAFSGALDIGGLRLPSLGPGGFCLASPDPCFYLGRDFLAAGAATGFFQTLTNGDSNSTIRLRYWQNDFFFSDQYQARKNLTVTLGVRYELNTVPTEVDGKIESTFTSPEVKEFESIEKNTRGVSGLERFLAGRTKIFNVDKNNFAPYASMAWDPFGRGKTSVRAGYGIYYDQILGAVVSQSRNVFPSFLTINFGGFNNNYDVNDPVGSVTALHPFIAANPATLFAVPGTLNKFDPAKGGTPVEGILAASLLTNFAAGPGFVLPSSDLVTPYSQHWGLTVEHQFGNDYLASAAYVGTRGVHLLGFETPNLGPNTIPAVAAILKQQLPGFPNINLPVLFGLSLPPNVLGKALRPFPLLGSIVSIESNAVSSYDALQLQLIKRFSRGFQFTTAYTWSHAVDEVSDVFDMEGTRALPQNSFARRAERADANFDVRHRFVYSLIWDLPIFGGNKALGGWQLGSIGTFQTGQPYSVLFCCDQNFDGNLTDRVDRRSTNLSGGARNSFRAPGIATVDLSVNKLFHLTERHRIEFRTEIFNVFNRTNFGIPVHQLFFGGYTTEPRAENNNLFVDTRVPKRTVQFALKYSF